MPIPKVNEWAGIRRGYVCRNLAIRAGNRFAWFRIIPTFIDSVGGLYCVSHREHGLHEDRSNYLRHPDTDCPFPVITNEPKKALIKIGHGGRGTR